MKNNIILLCLLLAMITDTVQSQNLIAVQNGGVPSFYTKLDSALVHAIDGDTIYIPGGNFTVADTINKRIHLVGVGHHPDSTNVSDRTIISGCSQLILANGASYGSVTGIYFNYPGYYCYPNILSEGYVYGYSISRCYVYNSIQGYFNDLTITECIISSFGNNGANCFIHNNIIMGYIGVTSSSVRNNVFTFSQYAGYPSYSFTGSDCIVENNIFKNGTANYIGTNNIYHNNINSGVNGISGTCQGSGNFLDDVDLQNVFVEYDPLNIYGEGVYNADFHLPVGSAYKNAGRDGTDIGIYGGTCPWKEGSIPSNPHFQVVNVAPVTDSSGDLNVNIKVAAQDR